MVLFSVNLVSAAEFDNRGTYDEDSKTLVIDNVFGLGKEIATLRLDTPLNYRVGLGYQKVAQITINTSEDYEEALKQIDFYNVRDNLNKIERTFDYKVLTLLDGEDTWNDFNSKDMTRGEVTIGIFTEVEEGDVVEWIPTFYGIEIEEWAVWTASIEVGLVSYWTLNETSGNMIDIAVGGGNDLIANNTPVRGVDGILDKAIRFDSAGDSFEKDSSASNLDFGSTQDFSLSFWINRSIFPLADGQYFLSGDATAAVSAGYSSGYSSANIPSFSVSTNPGGGDANRMIVVSDGGLVRDDNFHHIFLTRNDSGTDIWMFIDGVYNASHQGAFTHDARALNPRIGPSDGIRFMNGSTDEFGIWNRSLTFAEITALYNNGFAINPINITNTLLNAPTDDASFIAEIILFNATGSSSEGTSISNMTLWTNESGVWEAKNATIGLSGSVVVQTWNRNMPEGYFVWNSETCDSDDVCVFGTTNFTLNVDSTGPTIIITRPVNLIDYARVGTQQPINFTITDSNLDTCWYDYNATNYTFTCSSGVDGTFNISIDGENKSITLYANDTAGNENSATQAWDYKVFENSLTYNALAYETGAEFFTLNVSANSSLTTVALNYDGDSHTTSLANNISTADIDIPLGVENKTFNYTFTWAGESITSDNNFQDVGSTVLALCNATYTLPFANYTFADENTEASINASISTSNLTYYEGNGTVTKTLIFSNTSEYPDWTFCATPENRSLNLDPRIQYEAVGYPQRVYQPSIFSIDNSSINTTLYLLSTADGIFVTFQVINLADQLITDVFINATRLIGGTQELVGQGFTDSSGSLTMWLDPNFIHTFGFIKTGFADLITSFAPTQTSYTVTLGSTASSVNQDYTQGVTYAVNPVLISLINDTSYNFNVTIASSVWVIDQFGLVLKNNTGSILGTAIVNDNGGFVGLNLDTVGNDSITMEWWYTIEGTQLNTTRHWTVLNSEGTALSINNFLTDLNAYTDEGLFGLTTFGYKIIVFFLIFIFVGIMSFKYGITAEGALAGFVWGVVLFVDFALNLIPNVLGVTHFATAVMTLIWLAILTRGWRL